MVDKPVWDLGLPEHTEPPSFGDSMQANIDLLRELIQGMPPQARQRALRIMHECQTFVSRLATDSPKDPAVMVGVAFAVHKAAQHLVQARPLIQTLS
jgi:hypothetical protein